jgi:predicted HAD superfamily phosphohydrolase YqeG
VEFRIADTFTSSLAKLTNEEQKAVKTTAFDLQMDPSSPGMRFHRVDGAKDPNFWSVRVNSDIRLIVHKSAASLLLCYVDHHDDAYRWAERRRLETHPRTGAAQLVEIRETVREITVPRYVEGVKPARGKPALFAHVSQEELFGYGVPEEWLDDVKQANEDSLLEIAEHLPGEAAEALLDLATGLKPKTAAAVPAGANPFEHPDAMRRFRLLHDAEELARALEYPWEKWLIFLHPAQEELVRRDFAGPARVSGSAGTGKTIVALHRAAFLARANPDTRVLLTTFSDALANALRGKLRRLLGSEPRLGERVDVYAMSAIGARLYEMHFGRPRIATNEQVRELIAGAAAVVPDHRFSDHFLFSEWEQVVDAWSLEGWEAYRDVPRLGRRTRLTEERRAVLWSIFDRVRVGLAERGLVTEAGMFNRLAGRLRELKAPPFDYVVVDEAQDISIAQLRFLSALGADRPNALFFAGDLGQRIFQQPFSWKSVGVDIRGRSRTLRINYRTSHQIRTQADRLLGPQVSDVDGNVEERRGAMSVFNGADPTILALDSPAEEIAAVRDWLAARTRAGLRPHEIGVFVRSEAEMHRAATALEEAGIPFVTLDDRVETRSGHAALSTMHLAKGLEFRAVVVMACDDEVIPSQARIESVADEADLEEVYNTERHLLYVACTRARDHLLVTSGDSPSEFLEDLVS